MNYISQDEFDDAIENDLGWCSVCKEFTNAGVEPDAHEYECITCGDATVYGAEEALIQGMFCIMDDFDDDDDES
jgi:hypothetical protein